MNKTKTPNLKSKRKTKTYLTEQIKTNVISLLIEGLSLRQVTKQLRLTGVNISYGTIKVLKDKNITHINKIKKENKEMLLETNNEKYKKVVEGFLDVSRRAVKHITDEKLNESSGAALATIAGISIDKHTIATGGVTERIDVRFKNKTSMLDYIKGKKKDD